MSLIHYMPYLCFLNVLDDEHITVSKDINEVTCKYCAYYYFHPEARQLEIEFRLRREIKNEN